MNSLAIKDVKVLGETPPPQLIAPMRETALDTDPTEIRQRFADEAYVCLPGFFAKDNVNAVREAVFTRLDEAGEIRGTPSDGVYSGTSQRRENISDLGEFWREISENWSLRRVTHSRALHELCDVLLDEPCIPQDYLFLRAANFGRQTLIHSDSGFFARMTDKVVTVWISFGDIPLHLGPLFVMEKSHQHPRVTDALANFDVARDKDKKASWSETPIELAEQLPSRLLTRHMKPGDIVVFGMHLLHGSLDNVDPGQRIRLSCDIRYQAQSEPQDPRYFGPHPGGTTGAGYGELVGAIPLNEEWHIR